MTGVNRGKDEFALFSDAELSRATIYNDQGSYFKAARDRMDRTFKLIERHVPDKIVLDIGASPFYLLHRAKLAGAKRCHGTYFANDQHSLREIDTVYSSAGGIEISHSDAENDRLPFADDEVDVVSACEILEHFDYFPAHLASEMRRVLKPGGLLCITVPNVASIAHILKLLAGKNIYMRYRADSSGRHKHEYTAEQLLAFVEYLGMDVVRAGVLPSPTSSKKALRPFYRLLARLPLLKAYSPILYVLARQPSPKPTADLRAPPGLLYEEVSSTEE